MCAPGSRAIGSFTSYARMCWGRWVSEKARFFATLQKTSWSCARVSLARSRETNTEEFVCATPKQNGRVRKRPPAPQTATAFVSFVRELPSTDARSAEAVPAPRLESRGRAGRQICCGARDAVGIGSLNGLSISIDAHFGAHAPEGFHARPRTLPRRTEARRVH